MYFIKYYNVSKFDITMHIRYNLIKINNIIM